MQKQITIPYQCVRFEELDKCDQALVQCAQKASEQAYAPYSKFQVGCSLAFEDGQILSANNQENASYPCGTCAERAVLFYAHANFPDKPIKSIAIAAFSHGSFTPSPVPPCGACRQALLEYETLFKQDIRVLMYGEKEIWIVPSIRTLLPFQFSNENIENK